MSILRHKYVLEARGLSERHARHSDLFSVSTARTNVPRGLWFSRSISFIPGMPHDAAKRLGLQSLSIDSLVEPRGPIDAIQQPSNTDRFKVSQFTMVIFLQLS